ncbi:hypothetical protein C5167_011321 [Papaver somniferum]|uniref:Uncharacterized protein n=1 Tax=Papaver somniferum TaxID=3469 RepID=A0A4Y7K2Q5_PAPSO|nr:hypothetical protein C5167_011321 [Papaver somniferum]
MVLCMANKLAARFHMSNGYTLYM